MGSTDDLVFAVCSTPPESRFALRLRPGWHTVAFKATIPGRPELRTEGVWLGCGEDPPGSSDGGINADGARPDADSGTTADAEQDHGPSFVVVEDESGFGCRNTNTGGRVSNFFLLGFVGLLARRRGKRRY